MSADGPTVIEMKTSWRVCERFRRHARAGLGHDVCAIGTKVGMMWEVQGKLGNKRWASWTLIELSKYG